MNLMISILHERTSKVHPAKKSVMRETSNVVELKYDPRYLMILGCEVRLSTKCLSLSTIDFFSIRK